MTIQLTDSAGSNAITLVHGPGQATDTYAQGPMGSTLSFSGSQQAQITPLTRSEVVQVLPRRNHQSTLPFGALRSFSTLQLARSWAAAHTLAVQALTRLKITDGSATITMHGAMTTCHAAVNGVSVAIQYEFTYGKVETT